MQPKMTTGFDLITQTPFDHWGDVADKILYFYIVQRKSINIALHNTTLAYRMALRYAHLLLSCLALV